MRNADNLPPSCAVVTKSGNLNFLEPSGPNQACNGTDLPIYLTKLMHKICFTVSFISCLYMFRAHVLIIRRSKLHYTASGIITPVGVMIQEAV